VLLVAWQFFKAKEPKYLIDPKIFCKSEKEKNKFLDKCCDMLAKKGEKQ